MKVIGSNGQGQGHKGKRVENPYSYDVKLLSAITVTPVLQNIKPWSLRVLWGLQIWWIQWCGCHICHVTGN